MPALLGLVDSLQRQAADQVAFYPRERLRRAIEDGEMEIAFENGEPCGYLWHGPVNVGRDLVIYQAVIHYDLRRRQHGAGLVAKLVTMGQDGHASGVRCRCRSDIEANAFWRDLGFSCVAVTASGVRRSTDVNVWRRPIRTGLWDGLTATPSDRPSGRRLYDARYSKEGALGLNRFDRSRVREEAK